MDKLKAHYISYGGWIFKINGEYATSHLESYLLLDSKGNEGKIVQIGSEQIYEQGFSGVEEKYAFVTRDLNIRNIQDEEEFDVILSN